MRLGGKTKIFGSDKVKEMTGWDVKLTIYMNNQLRKDDDSGAAGRKAMSSVGKTSRNIRTSVWCHLLC